MSIIKEIIRDGWTLDCPYCREKILYTHLVNWNLPTPFYYSDGSNDVLLRKSDEERVQLLLEKNPTIDELGELWSNILLCAPIAPSGGQFSLWANVKCPHCNTEIPYNGGVKDLTIRIYDSKIIIIDGAIVLGDSAEDTWCIKVNSSR